MDAHRFDALTRALGAAGSRRGLLGLLLTLPVFGGLLAFFTADDAEAKGRRKRRKRRHKHGQGPPKNRKGKRKGKGRKGQGRKGKRRKQCQPESRATICAGTCGIIKNTQTCEKEIDCGSCACEPPCPACQICEAGPTTPGACVPDQAQVGDECGPSQVCQADGACACDADSCSGTTPICAEGTCVACSESRPCPTGCCAGDGSCQPGTEDGSCGGDGEMCQACPSTEFCQEAACQACDICTDGCTFDSIQAAIEDSTTQDGDVFTICPGRYVGLTTFSKSITIGGAGDGDDAASNTILDGDRAGTVVTIGESQTVTLSGLRITGGNSDDNSGGLLNLEGSTLTLSGCTVTDNLGSLGGGIQNRGTLTLNNCAVSHNDVLGGDVGGGLLNVDGTVTLNGCEVTHNKAGLGGGLYLTGEGMVNLNDCTVSHNEARIGCGGGLHDNSDSQPATPTVFVSGCTMTNNMAAAEGGAICTGINTGHVCIDTASIFADNEPDDFGGSIQIGGCS